MRARNSSAVCTLEGPAHTAVNRTGKVSPSFETMVRRFHLHCCCVCVRVGAAFRGQTVRTTEGWQFIVRCARLLVAWWAASSWGLCWCGVPVAGGSVTWTTRAICSWFWTTPAFGGMTPLWTVRIVFPGSRTDAVRALYTLVLVRSSRASRAKPPPLSTHPPSSFHGLGRSSGNPAIRRTWYCGRPSHFDGTAG
jgi:hypothetical protein